MYRSAEEEDREPGPLTTVARYLDPVEAQLCRAKLEGCAIRAVLIEPTGFNPLLTAAAGGMQLKVPEKDAVRARAILELTTAAPSEDDGEPEGTVRCPRCESAYCFHERPTLGAAAAGSGMAAVAWGAARLAGKRWRCRQCEHVWDDAEEGPRQRTQLEPDDPRPVFRLRRSHAGMGLFLGFVAGGLLAAVLGGIFAWALALFPIVGWYVGALRRHDVCSEPGCRAPLTREAEECPHCHGAVAGGITRAADHYVEAAEFRRELAALRAADRAGPRVERRRKKTALD